MRLLWGIAVLLLCAPAAEARTWTVRSPGGELTATVRGAGTAVTVTTRGLRARVPVGRFEAVRATRRAVRQRLRTPAGKRRVHSLDARVIALRSSGRRVEVLVTRDGVAIRGRGVGEPRYTTPPGSRAWLQRYTRNYEGPYEPTGLGEARGDYGYPALLETSHGWALLTEAGLSGDGAARLRAREGTLRVTGATVRGTSPWRLAIVGGLDDVVGSSLPLSLGGASRIEDPSWIRPGRAAWSWWSDSSSPERPGTQQAFVDAAAARGWEYVLVDEGWDAAWVPELVEYAAARGVRILLWTHWHELRDAGERARLLDLWASWGVAGIKADFLQSDRRSRIAAYDAIARAAARRRLVVNFHGSTLPRGLQRTWPNVLTSEAVLGAEHAKAGVVPAAHDVNLVFTRNAVGSMDYTPVAFSALGVNESHQLAQAVAFESGLQHLADTPAAYDARPAADALLRALPVAWDDTRLLAGAPGAFATLARRSGDEWWVANLSAGPPAERTVPLAFLPAGRTYTATLVGEGLQATTRTVTSADTLTVPVAADGGFTLRLQP